MAHDNDTDRVRVGRGLHDVLSRVMQRNIAVVETIQKTVGYHGSRAGINVNADAGVLRVRRALGAMLAAEGDAGLRDDISPSDGRVRTRSAKRAATP